MDIQSLLNLGASINSSQGYSDFQKNLDFSQYQLQLQNQAYAIGNAQINVAQQNLQAAQSGNDAQLVGINAIANQKQWMQITQNNLNYQNQLLDNIYSKSVFNVTSLYQASQYDINQSLKAQSAAKGGILATSAGNGLVAGTGSNKDILTNTLSEMNLSSQNIYRNDLNKMIQATDQATQVQLQKAYLNWNTSQQEYYSALNLKNSIDPGLNMNNLAKLAAGPSKEQIDSAKSISPWYAVQAALNGQ